MGHILGGKRFHFFFGGGGGLLDSPDFLEG